MSLSRAQRKLILLYARLIELEHQGPDENGAYVEIMETKKGNHKYFLYHANGGTATIGNLEEMRGYCFRTKPHNTKTAEKLRDAEEALPFVFPPAEQWGDAPICGDDEAVFSFGEKIGFSRGRARYIIDQEVADNIPTYSFSSRPHAQAQRFVEEFGGLYHLYRHDLNARTREQGFAQGLVMRATLSVRYTVPFRALESDLNRYKRVRCKLNLPNCEDEESLFKYDGFVFGEKGKNKTWSWLFQSRFPRNLYDPDLILMYTEGFSPARGRSKDDFMLRGVMLSPNQDTNNIPAVSSVVLVRQKGVSVTSYLTEPRDPARKGPVAYPNYLRRYFSMLPEDEHAFMRERGPVFLDPSDPATWDSQYDKQALDALFHDEAPVNAAGLHFTRNL